MWFYPLLLGLVVLAIVGGTLAGGVYTLVLIPLAVIAVVSWGLTALWGRSQAGRQGAGTHAEATAEEPLPHQRPRPSGRTTATPGQLADARRREQ